MQDISDEDLVQLFWGKYDESAAELVKAKRRLREGTGTELEVLWQSALLSAIRCDLATLGEHAVDPEAEGG